MKTILLFLCIIFNCKLLQARNGLENIIIEKYYISDSKDENTIGGHLPVGSVTYRIYADLLAGYKFQAVFGIPGHELRLATTTFFYNNEDKGGIIPNVIPDHNLEDNTVMLDSWLSVGSASEGNLGILKSDDNGRETIVNKNSNLQNADPAAGIPVKTQDGFIPGVPPKVTVFGIDSSIKIFNNRNVESKGSVFATTNGSWACLEGSTGPTAENRVLLAQLTTNGILSFELNIQIGTPDGRVEQYVAKNPSGHEIQLAGLIYSSSSLNKIPKPAVDIPFKK